MLGTSVIKELMVQIAHDYVINILSSDIESKFDSEDLLESMYILILLGH